MTTMLSLVFFLTLQGRPAQTPVGPPLPVLRVTVRLKDDTNLTTIATTDSFANGTFHFDNISLGFYLVSVADSRYLIKDVHLDLRQPEDTGRSILISLVRNGGTAAAPTNGEAYLDELNKLNMTELAAGTDPAAFEEFRKGVDLAKLGPKRNDILVPANGSPADTAEGYFKKTVSMAPDFYEGYFQLGLEQLRQSHMQDAAGTLEHAVTMNAADTRPLRVLGELYLQQKQFQKAVDSLVKVGTLGSLNSDDRYHLGVAFVGLDNAAAAQQQFSTAISLAPGKNPQAYLQLHNVDLKLNQLPEGIAVLDDFIRLFPNDPNHKMAEDRVKKLRETLKKQP
jgi:tetratricopeptide (TPR) repeat protein